MNALLKLMEGRLIVSCQAVDGDPLRDASVMARFAQMAEEAGAGGIRANGAEDIAAIRGVVKTPILGIQKRHHEDGGILITPTFEDAREIVEAGAHIVALDCTARGQRYGALDRLRRIRAELGVPVVADIATVEEAVAAAEAGADAVLTTMRGYTAETAQVTEFEVDFVRAVIAAVPVPVIAEGHIHSPWQAAAAIEAGALAVVVGSAITRPRDIARRFAEAVERANRQAGGCAIGIDLGGTNTKFAVTGRDGVLRMEGSAPTPALEGREVLLRHLRTVAVDVKARAEAAGIVVTSIGIATAGWVDPNLGRVVYATGNLPGWTGTGIREELESVVGLPVAVENDANALAVGEKYFGAAKGSDHFVCVTLGTGVGGGCYVGGRLNHGAHFMANALGHISIHPDGLPCNCGQKGCLEGYANAAALVRYTGGAWPTAEAVVRAAQAGDASARLALQVYARHLARGCSIIGQLLDPELIVLAGGIAQENSLLLEDLRKFVPALMAGNAYRQPQIVLSSIAKFGGVLGAAAVALARETKT